MIITCENCSTSFNLDEKFLKPSGSKVRCSKCKHIFVAFPETAAEEKEAPPTEAHEDESALAEGMAAAPEMGADSEAALTAEDGLEEAGYQHEGLGLDADQSADTAEETVEATAGEDPELAGMDAGLKMDTPPLPDEADEAEAASDDLGLNLEPDAETETGLDEELDLSSLDEVFDTEDGADAEDTLEDDLELELDMDAEPEADVAAEAREPGEPTELDDIDLSGLDEALDMEGAPAEEAIVEDEDAAGEDLLGEMGLEMETEVEAGEEAASDELDMSDIKFELGDDTEADAGAEDSELELGMDMEAGHGEDGKDVQEGDMVGFEETLEMDSPPEEPQADDEEGLGGLDLGLDLEMEADDRGDPRSGVDDGPAEEVEEEIEDLDFELDMEFEADEELEGAELELESEDTEDLDMSDIEQMLEVKDFDMSGGGAAEPGQGLEAEVEKWKDSPGEKGFDDDTAEIDLSDLEFDSVGVEDVEIEDQELDLDLDEETIKSAEAIVAGQQALHEEPEVLDISHFEGDEQEDEADASVLSEGDIALEFEVEGDATDDIGVEAASEAAEPAQLQDADPADVPAPAPPLDGGEAAEKPQKKKPKKEKKKKVKKTKPVGKGGAAKPVLAILLLLLIAFGAVVVLDRYFGIEIPYATEYVRQVPYVNDLMKPVMKKTGEITTANINSRFVENENSGRLFVITGQVKNEYPESRRFIQLTGRLFASGKALVKEEKIYCGNILTDTQLVQMNIADIMKKLTNRFGDNQSNVNVPPGQQLPFMVVFSDFPQDLEEFTIEIAGSSPVQQ